MKRAYRMLWLVAAVQLAGCTTLGLPAPGGPGGFLKPLPSSDSQLVANLLAEAPHLTALSVDDGRREQQLAGQAFAEANSEVARLRLAWLLALGVGGRNDVRLLMLLEDSPSRNAPVDSPLRQLWAVMYQTALERVHAQQESQARSDQRLRETETRLREATARAELLQQKLDAIVDVERTLNKSPVKRKRD